jgi:hypothetical protein
MMKVDVKKYKKLCNNSHYYWDHDELLHKLYNELGATTYEDGGYYWDLHYSVERDYRSGWAEVGFNSDGEIYCKCTGKRYKDPKKRNMHDIEANAIIQELLRVINTLDNFGFIIHEEENYSDEGC